MPITLWSAPTQEGNGQPFVQSTLSLALLDISPGQYIIPQGMLDVGTRLRIVAWGSWSSASSTTTTLIFGLYMGAPGAAISTASLPILGVGPTITTTAVAGLPWMIEYWGTITAASVATGSTTGQIVGRGRFTYALTNWTATYTTAIMPQTLALSTVQQTTAGMNTAAVQNIFVGCTLGTTTTGFTSITTNELTCEIIG